MIAFIMSHSGSLRTMAGRLGVSLARRAGTGLVERKGSLVRLLVDVRCRVMFGKYGSKHSRGSRERMMLDGANVISGSRIASGRPRDGI